MAEIPQSERLRNVQPSATLSVTGKASKLRRDGHDVLSLSAGEPDFDTPEFVKTAAIDAIHGGKTKYTIVDGIPELKAAIVRKFDRDNGLNYEPDQISVGPGGKAVIFNAMTATLNPGDEVIIPAPYWVSYPDIVRLNGAVPVFVETEPDAGFVLSAEKLQAAITARTRWLILNSPGNPSGACYDRKALREIADVLLDHPHVLVLTDDMYEHIIYGDFEFDTIAHVEPALFDRTLTVNGASKAYAMTGWRIGYAGGPPSLIRAMAKVMSQSTSNPCSISQWAVAAALDGDHGFLRERNAAFRKRRDLVVGALNTIPGLTCQTPGGAFYAFPSCGGVIGKSTPEGVRIESDLDFVTELLNAEKVAVVHGSAFGMAPFFRVSYATSDAVLEAACDRIGNFCASLK